MPHHRTLTPYHGIHGIVCGTIANATNLAAGIVHEPDFPDGRAVTIEDVGRVFQRLDNGVWYGLFQIAPVNWWVIGSGALNTFEHGDLPGGTLHAVATTSINGFYAATDKVLNDGHRVATNNPHATTAAQVGAIATVNPMGATGTATAGQVLTATSATTATWQTPAGGGGSGVQPGRLLIAGAGLTGGGDLSGDRTFNVGAHPDGSIAVNPDTIQVGILATDAQHGVRGGGTQHALATTTTAGFMSAADKTRLDNAVSTPLSNANALVLGIASAGTAAEASRRDHVHSHGAQGGDTTHPTATTAVAGFMSAFDKTKLDGLAVDFARLNGGNTFFGNQAIGTGDLRLNVGSVYVDGAGAFIQVLGQVRANDYVHVSSRSYQRLVPLSAGNPTKSSPSVMSSWFFNGSFWQTDTTVSSTYLFLSLNAVLANGHQFQALNVRFKPAIARAAGVGRMTLYLVISDEFGNTTVVDGPIYDDGTSNSQLRTLSAGASTIFLDNQHWYLMIKNGAPAAANDFLYSVQVNFSGNAPLEP